MASSAFVVIKVSRAASASGLSFLRAADFNLAVLSSSVAFKTGQAARITSGSPISQNSRALGLDQGRIDFRIGLENDPLGARDGRIDNRIFDQGTGLVDPISGKPHEPAPFLEDLQKARNVRAVIDQDIKMKSATARILLAGLGVRNPRGGRCAKDGARRRQRRANAFDGLGQPAQSFDTLFDGNREKCFVS